MHTARVPSKRGRDRAHASADVDVDVDVVGYGRPATLALARRIRDAKAAGHPLDPVTVIVPSNTTGLSARRLLAVGDPAAGLAPANLGNVSFVTPFQLAERAGAADLAGKAPLTNPVLAAAIRATLRDEPGIFRDVADHQATHAALAHSYGEISRCRPAVRAALAEASERTRSVVEFITRVEERLAGYFDEDDVAVAAAERLLTRPAAAAELGSVIWYLPDEPSPAMGGLLQAVLEAAPRSAVVIGLTGVDPADRPVLEQVRAVGVAVEAVDGSEDADEIASRPPVPSATRILSASDGEDEIRQVVREIISLAEDGTPLDRIGVFLPLSAGYSRTVLELLDAAGIPHNGPSTRRLADTVAGRTLVAALGLGRAGWGRAEILSLVAGAPVRSGGGFASFRAWDAISRRAGVVGGLDDWRAKLTGLIGELGASREAIASDASSAIARRRTAIDRDRETAAELLAFVDELAAWSERLDSSTTWRDLAGAATELLRALLGPENLRTRWPDVEVNAAQRVEQALERLGVLDEIDPKPSRATFDLAVASELDAPAGRHGRFGHGVLVAPLAAAVGIDLEAVFVVGMAEGTCPSVRRDDPLLPDAVRERAGAGDLPTHERRLAVQHRNYLAALAAGRTQRILSFPRGDLRGRRDRLPSRWLLDSASALAGRPVYSSDLAALPTEIVATVPSYPAGVARASVHGTLVDRDVAALLAATDPLRHSLVSGEVARGFASRQARASSQFTEWDGNLAGQPVPSPATGVPVSPTRLERWAGCPFRYFLGEVIGLRERDDPEAVAEISPANKGSLVHRILDRFFSEVLARPGGPPSPDQAWTTADRARVVEIASGEFADAEAKGLTGRPLVWRRVREEILADLEVLLTKDDEYRSKARVRPIHTEMAFGLDDEPPLVLRMGDGRELTFSGRADRVDRAEDGTLFVLDYKYGSGWGYEEMAKDPFCGGTKLQLGVYAEAALDRFDASAAESRYWIISTRGEYKQHGYAWTAEHRDRFVGVTAAIVEGIESGLFPALPGEYDSFFGVHENCRYCPFDRICPRDREDHQRATAAAPELRLLARLRSDKESG